MNDRNSGVVVVGVDETPGSRAALDFALQEGLARGCTVEIVTTWQWATPYEGMGRTVTFDAAKAAATEVQDEIVKYALDGLDPRPVVSQTVVNGYPGKALVARAETASMLVVGSGRKNAVNRALIGSVSEYCVRHSSAPVVVVPDPQRVHHAPHKQLTEATASGVMF